MLSVVVSWGGMCAPRLGDLGLVLVFDKRASVLKSTCGPTGALGVGVYPHITVYCIRKYHYDSNARVEVTHDLYFSIESFFYVIYSTNILKGYLQGTNEG